MIYNYKNDYQKKVFDTPIKRLQEVAIVSKIMSLLNSNKYNSIEEFAYKNQRYEDFLDNCNMSTVIKHFGNTITEDDYHKILDRIKEITEKKKKFDTSEIKKTNIGDEEYNTLKTPDKTFYIDNSRSNKTIEEQMRDIQGTKQEFQTIDAATNTKNMFNEFDKIKETLNLVNLSDIDISELNEEEIRLVDAAKLYAKKVGESMKIDIEKGILVDESDNIIKIKEENNEIKVIKDGDETENGETIQNESLINEVKESDDKHLEKEETKKALANFYNPIQDDNKKVADNEINTLDGKFDDGLNENNITNYDNNLEEKSISYQKKLVPNKNYIE